MNRIDRILWPVLRMGEMMFILILVTLFIGEALIGYKDTHGMLSIGGALVMAILVYIVEESWTRLRLCQDRGSAWLWRSRRRTANMRASRPDLYEEDGIPGSLEDYEDHDVANP